MFASASRWKHQRLLADLSLDTDKKMAVNSFNTPLYHFIIPGKCTTRLQDID